MGRLFLCFVEQLVDSSIMIDYHMSMLHPTPVPKLFTSIPNPILNQALFTPSSQKFYNTTKNRKFRSLTGRFLSSIYTRCYQCSLASNREMYH